MPRPDPTGSATRARWAATTLLAIALLAALGSPACAQRPADDVHRLVETGRYEEAETAARAAVAADSSSAELFNALGEVLWLRGKREQAEQSFAKAVALGGAGKLTAEYNLAVAQWERGEQEQALRAFDRFIDYYNQSGSKLSSEDLAAIGSAVRYLGRNDPQLFRDALRALDESIAADPGNLAARVRVGDLFLEKYNGPDARAAFAEALKLNPKHPEALLGIALAREFDHEGDAAESARKALETNPNLVAARVFLARAALAAEDAAQAEQELARALQVNPTSLEALSIQAALRYFTGDAQRYEETRRRILALNPRYSDLYATLAELAVQRNRYREAVDFAREAVALDAKSWRAQGLLGINLLRLGRIDEGRATLDAAFKGDPYNVWYKNTLDLLDTFANFTETRTARFALVLAAKESELLAPYMGELAEEAFDHLQRRYGVQPQTPVRLEVFPRHADFSVRTVGLAGLGALGVSFGNVLAMDSPSAREKGDFNWGSTLWHELAHAFHLGMTDHRIPRWLAEGLAVYEERKARPGWGQEVDLGFLQAYESGRLLPVSRLTDGFVRPKYPEQVIHSYFQASLVAEMIERDNGFPAIVAMLRAFRDGRTTEQVLREVLKTDPASFDKRFDAYMRERYQRTVDQLDDFTTEMERGLELLQSRRDEDAAAAFRRAQTLFPDYAGGDAPAWHLAQIHERRGELREAAAELTRLTAVNEDHYDANVKLAAILEKLGDFPGAAAALDRAIYIYPFDVPVHERLAELYARTGDRAKVVRERRAVVALQPADRAEALYQLAVAYMQVGDRAAARREVVRALETAPNFERAQELLLQLRGS